MFFKNTAASSSGRDSSSLYLCRTSQYDSLIQQIETKHYGSCHVQRQHINKQKQQFEEKCLWEYHELIELGIDPHFGATADSSVFDLDFFK